jgi:hypothetical protein
MIPSERTSPFISATATAIVSAWTSNPTNRTLFMAGSHSYVALRHGAFPLRSVIHALPTPGSGQAPSARPMDFAAPALACSIEFHKGTS